MAKAAPLSFALSLFLSAALPAAPALASGVSNLVATATGPTQVTLTWNPGTAIDGQGVTAIDGQTIFRCTGANCDPQGGIVLADFVATNVATYTDNSVVAGNTYVYQIRVYANGTTFPGNNAPASTLPGSATKLAFTNPSLATVPAYNGTNATTAVSEPITVRLQDVNSQAAANPTSPVFVKLTSNTTGTAVFYKESTGTAVFAGGCATIPITANFITFRYRDTAPSNARTIIATDMTLTGCTGEDGTLANATSSAFKVQVAPKSVTLTGEGLGTPGSVSWLMCGAGCAETTISSTALCSATTPVANTPPCVKSWPASGKMVTLIPPAADLGTLAFATVNGGTSIGNSNTFYYGPVITDVKPQTGLLTGDELGGTQVTIAGMGFGAKPLVFFGQYMIDTGAPAQKCTAATAIPAVTTGCWKSANPTKIVVLSPTQAQAISGEGDQASISVQGGGEPWVDTSFYYNRAVLTDPIKALFLGD